jgi:hypothetical protein
LTADRAEDWPRHWRWKGEPRAPGPAVVFDLDGVLSDASARQHFLTGPGKKNWKGFFDAVGDDPLIEEVARLTEVLDPAVAIVLLTGRPLRVQSLTVTWLEKYEPRWDLLVMRPSGDYGLSPDFKRSTVRELRERGFDVRLAIEDDTRNRDMFLDEGVPCIYLHSGYYENAE